MALKVFNKGEGGRPKGARTGLAGLSSTPLRKTSSSSGLKQSASAASSGRMSI